MKKLLAITALLLATQIVAIAQNWDLFPKGQYSMFEITFSNQPSFIERVVKDSISVVNDSTRGYFNSKWSINLKCSKLVGNEELEEENRNSNLDLNEYAEKNNWYYFYYSNDLGGYQFKFNAQAKVNESWTTSNNITFKCDSVGELPVFGQKDSVKYFSNSKVGIPFVLSKTFGLIEFAPFKQLIGAYKFDIGKVKLIGLETGEHKMGLTIPEFKDFFHLHQGDVIFWNYYYQPWDIRDPIVDYYYKDSITSSTITSDSVIYEIDNIIENFVRKDRKSYYKDKITRFLNPNISLGFFSNDHPCGFYSDNLLYWQCSDIASDSSVFSLSYFWSSLMLDTTNCQLRRIMDAGSYFSLNTRVGLSACNGSTVVGSIINGEKWGMTTIPTGISTMEDASFKVYPNPVSNKIRILSKVAGKLDYKLFNSNGQLVKAGQVGNQTIEVADLPEGLYHLQLGNEKLQETKKIIKVNKP